MLLLEAAMATAAAATLKRRERAGGLRQAHDERVHVADSHDCGQGIHTGSSQISDG